MSKPESPESPALRIVKATGAIVDLTADTEELLLHADDISEQMHELRSVKAAITEVVARRMDRANMRQGTYGRMHVKVNAPTERVWDVDTLRAKLFNLVEEGVLDFEAIERAVPSKIEYRVALREINKLRNHPDERIAELIEENESFPEVSRYMTLKPVTPGSE